MERMDSNQRASFRLCQILCVLMILFAIGNAAVGDWLAVLAFSVLALCLLGALRAIRRRKDTSGNQGPSDVEAQR